MDKVVATAPEAVPDPQGGDIIPGHPLGASDARPTRSAARRLAHDRGGAGVTALRIGVDQDLALVLER
jgi:acetyl-CoA acetyltransferase